MTKGAFLILIGVTLLIAGGIYEYPYLLAQCHEKEWPDAWNAELYKLNHRQIVEKIGPPTEDAAAKQYQSWLLREPWGVFQLKITFDKCCDDDARPSGVYKIVRARDRYEPAVFARLTPSNHSN